MVRKHIRDNGHSDRVIKKCQRIAGLKALLAEWSYPITLILIMFED
jgi:hypothetical protein